MYIVVTDEITPLLYAITPLPGSAFAVDVEKLY